MDSSELSNRLGTSDQGPVSQPSSPLFGTLSRAALLAGLSSVLGCTTVNKYFITNEAPDDEITDSGTDDTGTTEEAFEWEAPAVTVPDNSEFVSDVFDGTAPNTYWLMCTTAQSDAFNDAVEADWSGGWGGYSVGELYDSSSQIVCDALYVQDGTTGEVAAFPNIVITPAGDSTENYMSSSTFAPLKLRLDEGEGNEDRCIHTPDGDCLRNLYLRPDWTTTILNRPVVDDLLADQFPMKEVATESAWLYLNVWQLGKEPINIEADFDHGWRERQASNYGGEEPQAIIKGYGDLTAGEEWEPWEVATGDEEAAQTAIDEIPDFIAAYDASAFPDAYDYLSTRIDLDDTAGGFFHFWAYGSLTNLCDSYAYNNMVYSVNDSGLLGKSLASEDYALGYCGSEFTPFLGYSDGADAAMVACFQNEACFERAVATAIDDTRAFLILDPLAVNQANYDALQANGMARGSDASSFSANDSYLQNVVDTALPKLEAFSHCYDARPESGMVSWESEDGLESGTVNCPWASWASF